MTPTELINELAAAVRDVLSDTHDNPDKNPDSVFLDIARRLVIRLSPIAAFVPRDSIVPSATEDVCKRVNAVSRDLVRVLGIYRRAGYDKDTLETALLDAAVRLRRSADKRSTTSQLLRELADEALKMARYETTDMH